MKEYNFKQIKSLNKSGIQFEDGQIIIFEECRVNWANSRAVNYEDSYCVADRNISENIPYFLFYTNEKIKVLFPKSIFPWISKHEKMFLKLQMGLNRIGYSSYDCS